MYSYPVHIIDRQEPWIDPNAAALLGGGVGGMPVIYLDAMEMWYPKSVVTRTRPDGSTYRELDPNAFAFDFNIHLADNFVAEDPDIYGGDCYCGKWKCPGCGSAGERRVETIIQQAPDNNSPGGPVPPGGCSPDPQIRAGQCIAGYTVCCDPQSEGVIQDILDVVTFPHGPQSAGCSLHDESECSDISLEPPDGGDGFMAFNDLRQRLRLDVPRFLRPDTFADDCHIGLVNLAWNLLLENIDLVSWAECIVRGPRAGCLGGVIAKARVRVKVDDHSQGLFGLALAPCAHGLDFESFPPTNVLGIEICDDQGSIFFNETQAFCCDATIPGEKAWNELCAAIDLASWFAHESVHLCFIGERGPGECGKAYLIGNLVRWALLERYPAALRSLCCNHFPGIYLQNWDIGEAVNTSCFHHCR